MHFDVCVGIKVNKMTILEAWENAASDGTHSSLVLEGAIDDGRVEDDDDNDDGKNSSGALLVGDFLWDTTVVLVNPLHKGSLVEFLHQSNKYRLASVMYMSCNPATQARDAKLLLSFQYCTSSIQPFSLFPQTRPIKCLAVFERMVDGNVKIMV